jgi:hypothetical protein
MQCVILTTRFVSEARKAGLTEGEVSDIVTAVACDPQGGDAIVGTGGARKMRFGGRGKGKSGGYRVITFYAGADLPVFLLNVFAKGDRVDLTQAERNEMRRQLAGLAEDYRNGDIRHAGRG